MERKMPPRSSSPTPWFWLAANSGALPASRGGTRSSSPRLQELWGLTLQDIEGHVQFPALISNLVYPKRPPLRSLRKVGLVSPEGARGGGVLHRLRVWVLLADHVGGIVISG